MAPSSSPLMFMIICTTRRPSTIPCSLECLAGIGLDDEHVAKLLNAFEEVPQTDKAGCAFFFKEHVIAVLRVGKEYHFVDSLGGGDASGMGTRTVCADVEALRVFLRYYVSKKLPPGCVGNAFDEATADFDARVFRPSCGGTRRINRPCVSLESRDTVDGRTDAPRGLSGGDADGTAQGLFLGIREAQGARRSQGARRRRAV